ncbi:DUF4198 domain-containing protein [Desulfobacter hydrogenophilus]|uniref:DUF4198 domain-containing protein n=1 Tax=Desulfobacter hydrogenophilus TaxID=2291 RepID=A0A328FAU7_9BACT|nr:DUF4198 domain-containing protein [Desulfobacter hydrogenophilus]NDY74133.1 DUF4198 domain-containing protein [Desulfobacter hydrogenophilus]QBH15197.1 DUF4198 domain-containing protein [Desulfobacter hydrogenophilus]RAM00255.1 DUF4198 domain-containing protein [Desulfobacter hydrogenophilus]
MTQYINAHFRLSHKFLLFLVPALICFTAASALAHTLYIQPTRFMADKGKSIPFFFCYGHFIPVADGIRGKKLNKVQVIAPDGQAQTVAIMDGKGLHSHMVEYNAPGIWGLTAETTPGYYTFYKDKNGKERHAIKSIDKIKNRLGEVIKSYYSKQYAKTYVRCETPTEPFPANLGLPLELIPVQNLFKLKPGSTLELDVYLDGKPYTGKGTWDATYMGFSTQSEDNFYPQTPVEGSRVSISLPNPGRWFIRYFIKVDAPEQDKDKYLQMKLTTSLTLQIDNERKTAKPKSH